jgi:hypothetical protein
MVQERYAFVSSLGALWMRYLVCSGTSRLLLRIAHLLSKIPVQEWMMR